jgi:RND family efflux transporter MFP subunit
MEFPMSVANGQVGRNRLSNRDPQTIAAGQPQPDRKVSSFRSSRLWAAPVAVVVLGAGLGLASIASSEAAGETEEPLRRLAVRTVVVEPVSSFQAAREYTGTIVARRTSELGFELAGKLTELRVNEGDPVTTGDVLARLDTEHLETHRRKVVAQRAQASAKLDEMISGPRDEDIAASRARVDSLRAQVDLLKLQTSRRERLLASDAASRDEYEQHAFGLQARQAQLDEAQHELEELLNGTRKEQLEAQRAVVAELDAAIADIDVDLRKSDLKAPFDGTIARRMTDDGTVVDAGQPVFRLVEDGALEAWIGLPADAASKLIEGSSQRVRVRGEHFAVTVASRFPEVDPATRTRTVVLELDAAASRRLVQGQVVRLEFEETVSTDGFWLPTTALTKGARGLWSALAVETSDGAIDAASTESLRVARRDLEVLHAQSDRVLVRGTLDPGDRIITDGTHRVVPGQLVRLAR